MCEEKVHVNSEGEEHVHVCVCVFNREISTQESIDSSSNSLYTAVGVEIHIFVGFFLYPSSQMTFFFPNIREQKGEGHTSVLSAWKRNHRETLPISLISAL